MKVQNLFEKKENISSHKEKNLWLIDTVLKRSLVKNREMKAM